MCAVPDLHGVCSYLVVGSDGVWDMMTEQEVADWFTQAEKAGTELTRAVQGLVEEAVNRWTSQGMQADDTSLVCAQYWS